MLMYPFDHECKWRGPYYFWTSTQTDDAPPEGCQPVYACEICGATRAAAKETK